MAFDPWSILLELLVGGAGFVLFTYGRRQERLPQLLGGLACMVFPFFVSTVAGLLLGAAVVLVGTWWAVRMGF